MRNEFLESLRDNPVLAYAMKHLPESKLQLHGHVYTQHYRDGDLIHCCDQGGNTFTTEGMAALLNIIFGTTSKAGSAIFYVGIYKSNATPTVNDTAALKLGAGGSYGECQDADYSTPATDKPSYTIASTATASCTNAASAASFTIASGASFTAYGAFLSTVAAKTATTGYLMCAKKFGTARAVIADDVLAVTYAISLTTS